MQPSSGSITVPLTTSSVLLDLNCSFKYAAITTSAR